MRFHVLDAERPADLARWRALWERWPGREVMASPAYVRLFARPGDRAVCLVGEGAGATILFPLVLRPLAAEPWAAPGEARWDATSPYGFGGPFALGDGVLEHEAFWDAYEAFCREARIVTTFARLSVFPGELAPIRGRVVERGPNVVRDLRPGLDAIWRDYAHNVRTNVRGAQKAGLRVEVDVTGASLDAFVDVYHHTMERRGASEWYFFSRPFFEAIVANLTGQFGIVNVLAGSKVLSSELVLASATRIYSFLGGTRAEAFKLRPNDLVRHGSVVWGVETGKSELVLGGGFAPEDGILRHKRYLAPNGDVPFRVAELVHDEPAFDALVRHRAALAAASGRAWAPREDFFPPYRA
ncbi:MAG TPA: GNAT family N-acetyltransferase [Anaeromyxobacteraceae bacterium]|nr:GNAT family N-acetyltransferase [Anaeromyxobacteraceae bacterium]